MSHGVHHKLHYWNSLPTLPVEHILVQDMLASKSKRQHMMLWWDEPAEKKYLHSTCTELTVSRWKQFITIADSILKANTPWSFSDILDASSWWWCPCARRADISASGLKDTRVHLWICDFVGENDLQNMQKRANSFSFQPRLFTLSSLNSSLPWKIGVQAIC